MPNNSEDKKQIYKKWWFWLIIVEVIIAIGGSSSNENTTTLTSGTGTQTTQATQTNTTPEKEYTVGEIYQDGYIAIKYVSLNDNFTGYNKYATVKSGYKVIKADFEFENLSESDEYVSEYEFNCYADGYDCESFYSVEDRGLSATLSKGKKTKGSVYFEVPINAQLVEIEYETNVWTSEKVKFIVK